MPLLATISLSFGMEKHPFSPVFFQLLRRGGVHRLADWPHATHVNPHLHHHHHRCHHHHRHFHHHQEKYPLSPVFVQILRRGSVHRLTKQILNGPHAAHITFIFTGVRATGAPRGKSTHILIFDFTTTPITKKLEKHLVVNNQNHSSLFG